MRLFSTSRRCGAEDPLSFSRALGGLDAAFLEMYHKVSVVNVSLASDWRIQWNPHSITVKRLVPPFFKVPNSSPHGTPEDVATGMGIQDNFEDGTVASPGDDTEPVTGRHNATVAALEEIVAKRDGTIVDLRARIEASDTAVAALQELVKERDITIAALNQRLEALEACLLAERNSHSIHVSRTAARDPKLQEDKSS